MYQELNNSLPSQMQSTEWTRCHDPEDSPDRWEKMAQQIPGKSPEEMKYRYEALAGGVLAIESGLVELPSCADDVATSPERVRDSANQFSSVSRPRSSGSNGRKGTPWSVEEHKRFLMGLEKYGRGDWRSISRNSVVTRTPSQVASHAQKFFLRQSSTNKKRKRASIHDITTVDTNMLPPAIGQEENFLFQNSTNNETTRPASMHDTTTVDTNVVSPDIGPWENWNSIDNDTTVDTNVVSPAIGPWGNWHSTDNETRLAIIHERTAVDTNVVALDICPWENLLCQYSMDNERRLARIHDITTVNSNMVTPAIGQNWVPLPEPHEMQQWNLSYHFPHQPGGYGYAYYGFQK